MFENKLTKKILGFFVNREPDVAYNNTHVNGVDSFEVRNNRIELNQHTFSTLKTKMQEKQKTHHCSLRSNNRHIKIVSPSILCMLMQLNDNHIQTISVTALAHPCKKATAGNSY